MILKKIYKRTKKKDSKLTKTLKYPFEIALNSNRVQFFKLHIEQNVNIGKVEFIILFKTF